MLVWSESQTHNLPHDSPVHNQVRYWCTFKGQVTGQTAVKWSICNFRAPRFIHEPWMFYSATKICVFCLSLFICLFSYIFASLLFDVASFLEPAYFCVFSTSSRKKGFGWGGTNHMIMTMLTHCWLSSKDSVSRGGSQWFANCIRITWSAWSSQVLTIRA